MTSPDFSGIPTTAPGVVRPRMNSTEAQLAEQRRLTEALTRRDLSNAGVGAGGRLRAYYKDGTRGVLIGTDPDDGANKVKLSYDSGVTAVALQPGSPVYGSRTQLTIRDLNNRTMMQTDELAGFGLAAPRFALPIVGLEAIGPGMPTTSGTAAVLATGRCSTYNPSWYTSVRIRCLNGVTAFTANVFLRITCQDGTVITSTTTSFTVNASAYTIPTIAKVVALRAVDMDSATLAEWMIYITGSDATLNNLQGTCPLSYGVPQSFYESNPSLR